MSFLPKLTALGPLPTDRPPRAGARSSGPVPSQHNSSWTALTPSPLRHLSAMQCNHSHGSCWCTSRASCYACVRSPRPRRRVSVCAALCTAPATPPLAITRAARLRPLLRAGPQVQVSCTALGFEAGAADPRLRGGVKAEMQSSARVGPGGLRVGRVAHGRGVVGQGERRGAWHLSLARSPPVDARSPHSPPSFPRECSVLLSSLTPPISPSPAMDADSPVSPSSYLRPHSSHARSRSWGSSTSDGQTFHGSAIELDSLSYASVRTDDTMSPLEPHTPLGEDGQPERAQPHVSQRLLKAILLVSGIASIAQFAVAIPLFASPVQLSIDSTDNNVGLAILPTVANVTNKAANFWLSAAVALVGLWAWEHHLAKRGTSLDEMKGWGALLTKNLAGTVLGVVKVGWLPALLLVFMMGLILAATSAVTNALTPVPSEVTTERQLALPSPFSAGLYEMGNDCADGTTSWCPPAMSRD